jgi:hypothetical protein
VVKGFRFLAEMKREYQMLNNESRMTKDGIARAAQALAPRVAKSFL